MFAAVAVGENQLRQCRGGIDLKESSPSLVGTDNRLRLTVLVGQDARGGHVSAVAVHHLKSHTAAQALHKVAAFGVEVHRQSLVKSAAVVSRQGRIVLLFFAARQTVADAHFVDGWPTVVAFLSRFSENREDTRKGRLSAPVHHVSRVGTYFVETCSQNRVEQDVAVCHPVVDAQFSPFDHIAAGIEQIDIEHTAHTGGRLLVGTGHIGLEPDVLALEIAGVVEVEIDFLLRIDRVEQHGVLDKTEQRVGRFDSDSRQHPAQQEKG